jgi:hypothetical protein
LLLAQDEGVEVRGYNGHVALKSNMANNSQEPIAEKNVVHALHETINSTQKIFSILNVPFRHNKP